MLSFHPYFRHNSGGRQESSTRQPHLPQTKLLGAHSVRGWVDHAAKERGQNESVIWNFPNILPGIKPETSRTVAQYLSQMRQRQILNILKTPCGGSAADGFHKKGGISWPAKK
jgi:hypothetical protein